MTPTLFPDEFRLQVQLPFLMKDGLSSSRKNHRKSLRSQKVDQMFNRSQAFHPSQALPKKYVHFPLSLSVLSSTCSFFLHIFLSKPSSRFLLAFLFRWNNHHTCEVSRCACAASCFSRIASNLGAIFVPGVDRVMATPKRKLDARRDVFFVLWGYRYQ